MNVIESKMINIYRKAKLASSSGVSHFRRMLRIHELLPERKWRHWNFQIWSNRIHADETPVVSRFSVPQAHFSHQVKVASD
jgi:hypothetical protein